jgi:dGTPase
VLDGIFPYNITLQTLHGILSHNGEIEEEIFYPSPIGSFEEFDELMSRCYTEPGEANRVNPATLEAAVVRISDIIAYLGKDRQDAARVNMVEEDAFYNAEIGSINSEIINNLVANIIENSYGKPYIRLGHSHFEALAASKRENYSKIYDSTATRARLDVTAKPMMAEIYCRMLEDLLRGDRTSPIYTHHIDYVNKMYYKRSRPYEENDPHLIVVDFIASMTESFFIEFHRHLFPSSNYEVVYKGYFD